MKTLDEVIKAMAFCTEGLCDGCPYEHEDRRFCEDAKCAQALHYLYEYRNSRKILKDDNVVAYFGRIPIVKLGNEYYSVREYVQKHKAWRCQRMEWSDQFGRWFVCDDDNYIINNGGNIICREVGWDLKEVYEDLEGDKYGV